MVVDQVLQVKVIKNHEPIVKDVDIVVRQKDKLLVLGPNGVGKSTLLHLMAGLEKPDKGKIEFKNFSINSLGQNRIASIRNKNFGFIYQFTQTEQNSLQLEIR